jgi:NADH-quinone oxidoreductase subunit L
MTGPLIVLGGLAAFGGLVNLPWLTGLEHFLEPSFEAVEQAHLPEGGTPWVLAAASIAVALAGVLVAYRRYMTRPVQEETGKGWDFVEHGYRVDDLYGATIVLPGKRASEALAFTADAKVVDGAVNGVGRLAQRLSAALRPLQTGFVRSYGVGILAGTVGLVVWLLVRGGAI